MNQFLDQVNITFRRDHDSKAHINKPDSRKDREQRDPRFLIRVKMVTKCHLEYRHRETLSRTRTRLSASSLTKYLSVKSLFFVK